MRTPTKLTPKNIYYQILKNGIPQDDDYIFVILGKPGPSGKTWLCNQLRGLGYTVYELTHGVHNFIDFTDEKNHYVVDHIEKQVIIILNESL